MGTELRLLTDYLTNRKQYIVCNNHCSDFLDIVNGVPQGSILGPLLFSIYINKLIHTSNNVNSSSMLMTLRFILI